ncbi:MAG TPA: hypothetical protein V6D22_22875 [Candidatus Obscuribacterales bacterium]
MAMIAPTTQQQPPAPPLVEQYLLDGKMQAGQDALVAQLTRNPKDDQARFGLGMLQFLRAVQHLTQDLYRYGVGEGTAAGKVRLPFLRLQFGYNKQPARLTYNDARKMAQNLVTELNDAEATLAKITDPDVTLPLHFGMIRIDLNGDGRYDEQETLWTLYSKSTNNEQITAEKAKDFYVKFDRGDVHWLRGYCNLLAGIAEIYLAYDTTETFDRTAHLFFPNVETPYKFLNRGKKIHVHGDGDTEIVDFIAFIHTIRWPVVAPERMANALHHFEAVVAQSKETWKWIMAETDDDHEWLPNPRQTGVIPGAKVTDEMVTSWLSMMDQINGMLKGELLIPFWRGDEKVGINVRRVFLEPKPLDLVLWLQGTAAAPYLEHGRMTEGMTWRNLNQTFGGQFPAFAVWFN